MQLVLATINITTFEFERKKEKHRRFWAVAIFPIPSAIK